MQGRYIRGEPTGTFNDMKIKLRPTQRYSRYPTCTVCTVLYKFETIGKIQKVFLYQIFTASNN